MTERGFANHRSRHFHTAASGLVLALLAHGGCTVQRGPVGESDAPTRAYLRADAAASEAGPLLGICPSNECPPGRVTCPNNPFPCAVDLLSDDNNCGECGHACRAKPGGYEKCFDGVCQLLCDSTHEDCNGDSTDGCETAIDRDIQNCGGCGIACTEVPICTEGHCGCRPRHTYCGPYCKDLSSDNENCGACGRECPDDPNPPFDESWHAVRTCASGECHMPRCKRYWADCNQDFPDDPNGDGCETYVGGSDPNNCGRCGLTCALGEICVEGKCECPCGSSCFSVAADIDNCGACGFACPGDRRSVDELGVGQVKDPAHGRPVCELGVCDYRCTPNWADCDHNILNGCEVNLLDDPFNCGACGVRCDGTEGQACVNGQCAMKHCVVQ